MNKKENLNGALEVKHIYLFPLNFDIFFKYKQYFIALLDFPLNKILPLYSRSLNEQVYIGKLICILTISTAL